MEPVFKRKSTTLQETSGKSPRFNYLCIDCCSEIIALGTDVGSCHLYDSSTLQPLGEIIFLPEMPYSTRSQKQQQSTITDCKFSPIRPSTDSVLLLLATASGHVHLFSVKLQTADYRAVKVQSLQIDDNGIRSVLWCKLEKLMENYNDCLHRERGSKSSKTTATDSTTQSLSESESHSVSVQKQRECAALEALKVLVFGQMGRVYLVHFIAEYVDTRNRKDCPVRIVNVQLLFECGDVIIQSTFKMHFVVISTMTKALLFDFSSIHSESTRSKLKAAASSRNVNEFQSLSFVNGANMESMRYFIRIYQIGSKPRNGYFGACFDCQSIDECDQVLSARKSGRIWVAETQSGSVRNTLRFKMTKTPNMFSDSGYSQRIHDDADSVADSESIPDSIPNNLGILVPFGNWTLSYCHPLDIGTDTTNLEPFSLKSLNSQRSIMNQFGLKILDQNVPEMVHWYPSMGRILDISVVESQCSFYAIYKPLDHQHGVIMSKIELCSATESVIALMNDNRISTAIDWVCSHKVTDLETLETVKKQLVDGGHGKGVYAQSVQKFMVHFEGIVGGQSMEEQKGNSDDHRLVNSKSTNDSEEKDEGNDAMDSVSKSKSNRNISSLSVPVMTSSAARARRKSSANRQVFNEAVEESEALVIGSDFGSKRQRKKSKKKKKGKPLFVAIDPGPKRLNTVKEQRERPDVSNSNFSNSFSSDFGGSKGSGNGKDSVIDSVMRQRDEMVVPVIDEGDIEDDVQSDTENVNGDDSEREILKLDVLLRATTECDMLLRRRMRGDPDGNLRCDLYDDSYGDDVIFWKMRDRLDGHLMAKMSLVLGEVERMNMDDIARCEWTNAVGERISTALTRMLCVFIWFQMESGKQCEDGVLEILQKFVIILDFEWVIKLCNARKLHRTLRHLAVLQYQQNETIFDREAVEKAFCTENYRVLLRLIDEYGSPLLMLQYLPSLCAAGQSQLCCSLAVAFFPYISPWFVRHFMYRKALDSKSFGRQRVVDDAVTHSLLTSNLFYLKLLFKVHPRTRCNALLVLDVITLTLSLNRPPSDQLFRAKRIESESDSDRKDVAVSSLSKTEWTQFEADKVPAKRSENAYPEPLTKYIISMLSDRSYFVEWSFLEIVFKEYGFWRGLSRVYLHFDDIHSLSVLALYLDRAQPILDVLSDTEPDGDGTIRYDQYRRLLITLDALSADHPESQQNVLNLPLIVQHMMTNLGAQQTAQCLSDPEITPILGRYTESNPNGIPIYREIVHQQRREQKRDTLTRSVLRSLSDDLRSRYTLHSITSSQRSSRENNSKIKGSKAKTQDDSKESKEYRDLAETLSGIKNWSDEWAVMRSVNAQPPKQRTAASLERNLSDLLIQFV